MRRTRRSELAGLERRLVWMMGSPRTGSTWLASLLVALADARGLNEPQIGVHLGLLAPDLFDTPARRFSPDTVRWIESRRAEHQYFFNDEYRSTWLPALRELILARFQAQVSDMDDDGTSPVIVKEPNGSPAADVLLAATPASRLLFLVRDGRDVIDSQLDATQPGSWLDELSRTEEMSAAQRLRYLEDRAQRWVISTQVVQSTYDSLPPERRLMVRYEDLIADTRAEVVRTLEWLEVAVPADINAVIAERAFTALADRGKGRFARAATPGLWRENLSAEEQRAVGEVMAATLVSLGYEA